MSALGDQDKKIKVAVRARPLHPERERYDSKCVRKVGDTDLVVTGQKDTRTETSNFSFDYAFDEDDQQIEIYNEAVLELVDSTLDGHNACVLAYGQTGSGKTFTMLGEVDENGSSLLKPNSGLFLRVLTDLFLYKERCKGHMHVTITLSIIEIYIQEVRDLLNQRKPLKVQTAREEVCMPDLKIVAVNNLKDVFQYFKIADKQRVAKKTAMNDVSSRSHALFMIDLFQQAKTSSNPDPPSFDTIKTMVIDGSSSAKCEVPIQKSRIVLVDLAGSERIGRSLVEGKMKEEAIAINMSLTVLGTVVTGLYKGSKHVSYRDSALTLTLKSVFTDPNCKVLLCANLSPANTSYSETKSTLTFANKVKEIKAQSVSVDPQAEIEYLERLRKLEELCGDLRIATVLHEFILQTPSRIRHVPTKDEGARATLLKEVVATYNAELAKRKAIKEQREEDEIHRLANELAEKEIKQMQQKQQDLNDGIDRITKEIGQIQEDTVRLEAEKKDEVEAKTNEAKKVRKQRRKAEEQIEVLEKQNATLESEIQSLKRQLSLKGDAIEREQQGEGFRNDEAEEAEAKRAEAHHADSQELFDQLMHLRNHQVDYLRHRVEVAKLQKEQQSAADHRLQSGFPFAAELVHWLVDHAVRTSEGKAAAHDGETFDHLTRLLPLNAWPNPLSLTNTHVPEGLEAGYPDAPFESDYESGDEDVTSPDNVYDQHEREVEQPPSQPVQYDFVSSQRKKEEETQRLAEEKAKQRQRQAQAQARQARSAASEVTKRYDDQEADKLYLMQIYDQDSLVSELLRYLYSGVVLTKHGRTGKPHKRKFFLPSVGSGQNELTWTELAPTPGDKGKRGVALSDITGIVMGMYSKVFKRMGKVGPATDGFYQSFTIVVKDGKRTIDVVAESVAEFEAWLLGLSNLIKKEPVWGETLDFEQLNDPKEVKLAASMSSKERDLCSKHHIRPSLIVRLREVAREKRDEVLRYRKLFNGDVQKVFQAIGGINPPYLNNKQALLMTKGELRYYSGIDIFRTCIIWRLFAEEDLIYDPQFRFPTQRSEQ
eukprot:TRINITY_DN9477_c0_g1_i1.p1 TRINITY_DN9477_c0_g1~~TRINITY_DN9477_c0_g1_i1.p1  ORF type:complete len:1049 (+),score=504.38 TRINITY_DN9477_c0_g1_i1:399-3545(+)